MDSLIAFLNQVGSFLHVQLFVLGGAAVTVGSLIELCILCWLVVWMAPRLNAFLLKNLSRKIRIPKDARKIVVRACRWLLIGAGILIVLQMIGIGPWILAQLALIHKAVEAVLELKLFKIGQVPITLWTVAYLMVLSWLLIRLAGELNRQVVTRVLSKTKIDVGVRTGLGKLIHYVVLFVGFVILLQTTGIDLSALTVLLGALGIGISFGLQAITNNFISGLIIFFERPIKIGDRVQIGDVIGTVTDISLRATTVLTSDNIAIIVPNSQFITANVINWSFPDATVGLNIPVTVSAKADPETVQKILLSVLEKQAGVLRNPPPSVLFEEMSHNSMKFSLSVATRDYMTNPENLRSDINFAVSKALKGEDVEVRFPRGKGYTFKVPPSTAPAGGS